MGGSRLNFLFFTYNIFMKSTNITLLIKKKKKNKNYRKSMKLRQNNKIVEKFCTVTTGGWIYLKSFLF